MRAPWDEAGQLRRPLPNALLRIVASGEREERRRRFGQCPLCATSGRSPTTHQAKTARDMARVARGLGATISRTKSQNIVV
jgi:hypothetical protein